MNNKVFVPLVGPERRGRAEIALCIADADLEIMSRAHTEDFKSNSSIAKIFGGQRSPSTVLGNEALQCCLTYVSVDIQHPHARTVVERACSAAMDPPP